MIAQSAITLCALVALAQSKAIVTNLCKHDVYVWTVPNNYGYANNKAVKAAGGQYIETFHQGTQSNPGIAIKVSPEQNGIYDGKAELDFAYAVDQHDVTKVWINLDVVRGNPFNGNVAFHTCNGPYKAPNVPTRQCSITDDIELVLCGSERTVPIHDLTPKKLLTHCAHPWWEPQYAKYANKTQTHSRTHRTCHGRLIVPEIGSILETDGSPRRQHNLTTTKPMAAVKNTTEHVHSKAVEQKKHQQPALQQNQTGTAEGCECRWAEKGSEHGFKCTCTRFVRAANKYHCLSTGDFEYCFDDDVAKKATSPDNFAQDYAKPLLHLLWDDACDIAGKNDWDCAVFKASIKAAYPGVDKRHKAGTTMQARNSTSKTPAEKAKRDEQPKRDFQKACEELVTLFAGEYSQSNCNVLVNDIKIRYGKRKVYLGTAKDNYLPGESTSDIKDEFKHAWPEVNWTTDHED